MDLDELREKWAEQDRKLDESLRLNRRILSAMTLNRAKSALQRLVMGLALEAVITSISIVVLGDFLYEHITEARFAAPAVALDVFAIVILNSLIRQILLALQIDYSRPIATIQKQLETLRMRHIRYIQGIFLTATLAWTPFFIVALKGLLGLDAYRIFNPAWLFGNVLFGLAIIPLAFWLSKRFGDRMGRSPLFQRLMRDLAGHSLNAAADFLAELSDFENEKRDS